MTLLIVFLAVVFTIVSIYFTLAPFLGGRRGNVRAEYLDDEVRELERLVARRSTLIAALRELEFEFETDKISKEDYDTFRARYEREAVAIMKKLDELHGGRGWEERVDEAVTERLGRVPRSSAPARPPESARVEPAEERVEESIEVEAAT